VLLSLILTLVNTRFIAHPQVRLTEVLERMPGVT